MKAQLIFAFNKENVTFPVEWNNYDIVEFSVDKSAEGIYFEDIYEELWKRGNPTLYVTTDDGVTSEVQYEELSGIFCSKESLDEIIKKMHKH